MTVFSKLIKGLTDVKWMLKLMLRDWQREQEEAYKTLLSLREFRSAGNPLKVPPSTDSLKVCCELESFWKQCLCKSNSKMTFFDTKVHYLNVGNIR